MCECETLNGLKKLSARIRHVNVGVLLKEMVMDCGCRRACAPGLHVHVTKVCHSQKKFDDRIHEDADDRAPP